MRLKLRWPFYGIRWPFYIERKIKAEYMPEVWREEQIDILSKDVLVTEDREL